MGEGLEATPPDPFPPRGPSPSPCSHACHTAPGHFSRSCPAGFVRRGAWSLQEGPGPRTLAGAPHPGTACSWRFHALSPGSLPDERVQTGEAVTHTCHLRSWLHPDRACPTKLSCRPGPLSSPLASASERPPLAPRALPVPSAKLLGDKSHLETVRRQPQPAPSAMWGPGTTKSPQGLEPAASGIRVSLAAGWGSGSPGRALRPGHGSRMMDRASRAGAFMPAAAGPGQGRAGG